MLERWLSGLKHLLWSLMNLVPGAHVRWEELTSDLHMYPVAANAEPYPATLHFEMTKKGHFKTNTNEGTSWPTTWHYKRCLWKQYTQKRKKGNRSTGSLHFGTGIAQQGWNKESTYHVLHSVSRSDTKEERPRANTRTRKQTKRNIPQNPQDLLSISL